MKGNPCWSNCLLTKPCVKLSLPCLIAILEEDRKASLATLKSTALFALFNSRHSNWVAREVDGTIVKIMKEGIAL